MGLVLASASQRRQDLLRQFGYSFSVITPQVEELMEGDPVFVAEDNARRKATACRPSSNGLVIGADTVVVCQGEILGKPVDEADAYRMLQRLAGQEHQVVTGVALSQSLSTRVFHVSTAVRFRMLADYEIKGYISTTEPFDKAGSYGIQGIGGAFVESIRGCYYNVVGLPMPRLIVELRAYGFDVFAQGG